MAVVGRKAFPLLVETATQRPVAAAGYYNDDESRARGVVSSHTGWAASSDARGLLTLNALRWAGRKESPVVALGVGLNLKSYLKGQGLAVKDVTTAMETPQNDLSGVDVFLFSFHSGYTEAALQKIAAFTAAGGGLVALATPWALSAKAYQQANNLLLPLGLGVNGVTVSQISYTVQPQPSSPYFSALNALDALLKEQSGQLTLTPDEQRTAAFAVEKALGAHPSAPILTTPVKPLSEAYGLIGVTTATPIARANKPVEAMRTRSDQPVAAARARWSRPGRSEFEGGRRRGQSGQDSDQVIGVSRFPGRGLCRWDENPACPARWMQGWSERRPGIHFLTTR